MWDMLIKCTQTKMTVGKCFWPEGMKPIFDFYKRYVETNACWLKWLSEKCFLIKRRKTLPAKKRLHANTFFTSEQKTFYSFLFCFLIVKKVFCQILIDSSFSKNSRIPFFYWCCFFQVLPFILRYFWGLCYKPFSDVISWSFFSFSPL
jgi:hypothetical protein